MLWFPALSVSVVPRIDVPGVLHGAASTSSQSARRPFASVGSVNWMSTAIARGCAFAMRSITRAWSQRGSGHSPSARSVASSTATTATSDGTWGPRTSNRASTVDRSSELKTWPKYAPRVTATATAATMPATTTCVRRTVLILGRPSRSSPRKR